MESLARIRSREPARRGEEHRAAGVDSDVVGLSGEPVVEVGCDGWGCLRCGESHVELFGQVRVGEVAVELGFAFVE